MAGSKVDRREAPRHIAGELSGRDRQVQRHSGTAPIPQIQIIFKKEAFQSVVR